LATCNRRQIARGDINPTIMTSNRHLENARRMWRRVDPYDSGINFKLQVSSLFSMSSCNGIAKNRSKTESENCMRNSTAIVRATHALAPQEATRCLIRMDVMQPAGWLAGRAGEWLVLELISVIAAWMSVWLPSNDLHCRQLISVCVVYDVAHLLLCRCDGRQWINHVRNRLLCSLSFSSLTNNCIDRIRQRLDIASVRCLCLFWLSNELINLKWLLAFWNYLSKGMNEWVSK